MKEAGPSISICLEEQEFGIRIDNGYNFVYIVASDVSVMDLYLKDFAASCLNVAQRTERTSCALEGPFNERTYRGEVDTPIFLNFAEITILIFYSPKSHDGLPVTLQLSYNYSSYETIRTTQAALMQFGQQLWRLLELFEKKEPLLAHGEHLVTLHNGLSD